MCGKRGKIPLFSLLENYLKERMTFLSLLEIIFTILVSYKFLIPHFIYVVKILTKKKVE